MKDSKNLEMMGLRHLLERVAGSVSRPYLCPPSLAARPARIARVCKASSQSGRGSLRSLTTGSRTVRGNRASSFGNDDNQNSDPKSNYGQHKTAAFGRPVVDPIVSCPLRIRDPAKSSGRLQAEFVTYCPLPRQSSRNAFFQRWFSNAEFHLDPLHPVSYVQRRTQCKCFTAYHPCPRGFCKGLCHIHE